MAVEFQDTKRSLSETLTNATNSITGETVTLRQLFELIGEQGLLMICAFLTIPFLVPVSIPGVSTVFGLAIILIGLGVTLNRIPWMPEKIMSRPLSTVKLKEAMSKGAEIVTRIDKVIRPRMMGLTEGAVINRINGFALIFAGVLLMAPFGLIPFSNTLPALAILFLAVGILQRDGYFIIGGYLLILATVIYFGVLVGGAMFVTGEGIRRYLGSGVIFLPWW